MAQLTTAVAEAAPVMPAAKSRKRRRIALEAAEAQQQQQATPVDSASVESSAVPSLPIAAPQPQDNSDSDDAPPQAMSSHAAPQFDEQQEQHQSADIFSDSDSDDAAPEAVSSRVATQHSDSDSDAPQQQSNRIAQHQQKRSHTNTTLDSESQSPIRSHPVPKRVVLEADDEELALEATLFGHADIAAVSNAALVKAKAKQAAANKKKAAAAKSGADAEMGDADDLFQIDTTGAHAEEDEKSPADEDDEKQDSQSQDEQDSKGQSRTHTSHAHHQSFNTCAAQHTASAAAAFDLMKQLNLSTFVLPTFLVEIMITASDTNKPTHQAPITHRITLQHNALKTLKC